MILTQRPGPAPEVHLQHNIEENELDFIRRLKASNFFDLMLGSFIP